VRIGSYARPLSGPGAAGFGDLRIVIQVAESVASRSEFTRRLVIEAISRDLLLIAVGGVLLTLLVTWALSPLRRLRREVLARAPDDLTPIEATNVPRDVAPLVDAINHHVLKSRELAEQRRRFVDDASHQLRTPLATLATQMTYALRETDPQRVLEALPAIKQQLDETVHRTNQMLALARADTAESEIGAVDLTALAEALTRERWNEARDLGIDLGFEPPASALVVRGHEALLREALRNLLDNALRYTPHGGHVTVRLAREGEEGVLAVVDDGPGIPPADRGRAGERFFRGSNVTASGSGLGLAIVRSVAQRSGGRMEVGAGPGERGCAIGIRLPLWQSGASKP
jgi:two-component system sensor histidine kinase TctE